MAMVKVPDDSWHFARSALAKKYIDTFEVGLISAQALFAPRRRGESESPTPAIKRPSARSQGAAKMKIVAAPCPPHGVRVGPPEDGTAMY
jgi:hypothetical protein